MTPLWAASVAGKLPVVKCLVRLGASINALSDTGNLNKPLSIQMPLI